jgi:hypothetical protein
MDDIRPKPSDQTPHLPERPAITGQVHRPAEVGASKKDLGVLRRLGEAGRITVRRRSGWANSAWASA